MSRETLTEAAERSSSKALAEASLIETQAAAAHRIYWASKLGGLTAKSGLPPDYRRLGGEASGWHKSGFETTSSVRQRLQQIAGNTELANFVTLFSVVAAWLFRTTQSAELYLGVPSKNVQGPCQILPIRLLLADAMTVKQLLKEVQQKLTEAFSFQDFPISAPTPRILVSMGELSPSLLEPGVEVTISFFRRDHAIRGSVSGDAGIFAQATLELAAQRLGRLMDALLSDLSQALSSIPNPSQEEVEVLLDQFSSKRRDFPLHETIQSVFERIVRSGPDRLAACHNGSSINYGELNLRANKLARLLRRVGVLPNQFVGILDERGIDFLVSIMAILKAGGAYVPIDPSLPAARIDYLVQNSQLRAIVTRRDWKDGWWKDRSSVLPPIICVDRSEPADESPSHLDFGRVDIDREEGSDLALVNSSRDVAYMLYTSGSTGLPKGAMVRHDGALNHIFAEFEEVRFHPATRFLQSAPACSDISVWQFLAPLLIGGSVAIVDFETVCDAKALFESIRSLEVTLIELVPSVLRELLSHVEGRSANDRALPKLEMAMICGEVFPVALVNQWFANFQNVNLVNAYGPTEASDDIAQYPMTGPLPENLFGVPIGYPIANVFLYVLDPQLKLLPIGIPGEICVAGVGVGAGYWADAERTAASFVANPFATSEDNRTLYRTGDLGRWLADGKLEFLGRLDQQIKIRGFRVEPNEIEADILRFPGIRQALAIVRGDMGNEMLVAYITSRGAEKIPVDALRAHLRSHLPAYMIPSFFVQMSAFPLNQSGKVDRKALPAPAEADAGDFPGDPPIDPVEQAIAEIWSDVLKTRCPNRIDSFFDLGGHSLLATQLVSKMRKRFSIEMPLRAVFSRPTIPGLADFVRQAQRKGHWPTWEILVPLQPRGSKPPLYLVHPFAGLVTCFAPLARSLGSDQPVIGIQAPYYLADLDVDFEFESLEERASGYIDAIQKQQPEGPYYIAGWSYGGQVAFAMAQALTRAGQEVAFLGMIDAYAFKYLKPTSADESVVLLEAIRELDGAAGPCLDEISAQIRTLPDEVRLRTAVDRLCAEGRLPRGLSFDDVKKLVRRSRQRNACVERYKPDKYSGRIDLFRAQELAPELTAPSVLNVDSSHGWAELTDQTVEIHAVPGDHHTLVLEPHALQLAAAMTEALRRSQKETSVL